MYCVKLLHKAMQAALSKPLSVLKCWPVASHPPLVSCPHISQLSPKLVEKSTEVSEFNGVFPISPRLRRGPTDLERWASFGTGPGAGGGELGVQSWWVFFIETTFRISPPVLKGRSSGFRIRALIQPNKQTNATNNKNAFERRVQIFEFAATFSSFIFW